MLLRDGDVLDEHFPKPGGSGTPSRSAGPGDGGNGGDDGDAGEDGVVERLDTVWGGMIDCYLPMPRFLGLSVDVNPELASALERAETDRSSPLAGISRNRTGVRTIRGEQGPNHGFHTGGRAIDLNYDALPFIATRTGSTFGGEASRTNLTAARRAAVEVCDRAVQFELNNPSATADLANRKTTEASNTGLVYDRFCAVNVALKNYLGLVFRDQPRTIQRAPAERAPVAGNPAVINSDPAQTIANLGTVLARKSSYRTTDPSAFFDTILRDYELVRVPFVVGTPSARPAITRNPVAGFLDISREVVVALCDVGGLAWGACDFLDQSGDMMHFDLGGRGRGRRRP